MNVLLKAAWTVLGRNLTPTSPQLVSLYSGGTTSSGETVSTEGALRIETVYACVKLIAGTIATLPAQVFRRDKNGRGTVTYDHPLYAILHDQANSDMTAVVFWEAMMAAFLLWGNAYAKIFRNPLGQVIALVPIKPDRVSRPKRRADGSIYYDVTTLGQIDEVDEGEMMHIKGFSLDGEVGLSVIALARESLGLALASEKVAGSLFRNGMRASFGLFLPTTLDDIRRRRYKEEFLPQFTGALNAGKVPLMEGGWEIKNLGMNPADAELLSTRAYSVEQICRWYGVQPVMIGHMEKSTAWGSGLEQMNLWFLTYTLRPILRSIEQEIRRSLLTPGERTRYYTEFNVEGLMRADSAGRAALMKVLAGEGLRTRNELRALDNMPPLPGGDELTIMSNQIPLSMLGEVARLTADKALPGDPNAPPPANENQGMQHAKP